MRSALFSLSAAVLLVGVVVVGGSSLFFPPTSFRIDIDHGRQVFNRHCASCHTVSETGGSRRAPSLHRIGEVGGTRVPGQDAESYILTSIVEPDAYLVEGTQGVMPGNIASGIARDELIDLVGFLSTLGGRLRPKALMAMDWDFDRSEADGSERSLDLASIERGRQLFLGKGNCAECHDLRRQIPGHDLMAPTLAKAGLNSREYLEQTLLDPSRLIVEGYETWMVSASGIVHSGRRVDAPEGKVRLIADDGRGGPLLLEFDRAELEPLDDDDELIVRVATSRMPPVGEILDREEIDAVLDFLMIMR